jgi:hypothetical protein
MKRWNYLVSYLPQSFYYNEIFYIDAFVHVNSSYTPNQTHNPNKLIAAAPAIIQTPAKNAFAEPENLMSPIKNSCANNSTSDAYISKPEEIESKTPVVINAAGDVGEYNVRMHSPIAIPIGVTTANVRPIK